VTICQNDCAETVRRDIHRRRRRNPERRYRPGDHRLVRLLGGKRHLVDPALDAAPFCDKIDFAGRGVNGDRLAVVWAVFVSETDRQRRLRRQRDGLAAGIDSRLGNEIERVRLALDRIVADVADQQIPSLGSPERRHVLPVYRRRPFDGHDREGLSGAIDQE
jgi:hypothetical protein